MEEVLAGRYALGAELGRGGMARVVAARDLRLQRDVAVKLLLPGGVSSADPAARRRFVREARSAASFAHPHAVAVFDAGEDAGVLYLVMELVDGRSLDAVIAERRLAVAEATRIGDEVLQALAAAHRAGIVHRDVKPGNVLIRTDGVAKLADFGIAKPLDDLAADVTSTGQFVGTPTYLAPEQVRGERATPATDVYAVGVLLFEMLAGRPPFVADSPIAIALAHRDATVPDVRDLRPTSPRRRHRDPTGDGQGPGGPLRRCRRDARRAGDAGATRRPDRRRRPVPGPPRSRHVWWWAALAAAVVTGGTAFALGRDDAPDQLAPDAARRPRSVTPLVPPPSARPAGHRCADGGHDRRATTARPHAPTVPPTVPLAASSVGELRVLVAADPARFGVHAEEIARRLEGIDDRDGDRRRRDVERLLDRVADWEDDGTLGPAAAAVIRDVLPVTSGERRRRRLSRHLRRR